MAGEVKPLEISFYFNTDEEGNITDSVAVEGNFTSGGNAGDTLYRHEVVVDSWEIPLNVDIIQWKYGTFVYKENPDDKEFNEATPPPLDAYFKKVMQDPKGETV